MRMAPINNNVTNAIATAAVVSPWWMPSISDISQGAALMLPILGCAWLIVQILGKLLGGKDAD